MEGLSSYKEFFSRQQDSPPTDDSVDTVDTPKRETKRPEEADGGSMDGDSPHPVVNSKSTPARESADKRDDNMDWALQVASATCEPPVPSSLSQLGPNLKCYITEALSDSVAKLGIQSAVSISENNAGNSRRKPSTKRKG